MSTTRFAQADGKNREWKAFEQLALAYMDVLHRFGMRLTQNTAEADGLVQETYLKAYQFWDRYDQRTDIRVWLFRILKSTYISLYRRESRGNL